MPFAIYPAFVFTVVLLVTTAYFLLGGLPLLMLAHDEAMDARFVRGFFNVYYKAAFWAAAGACLSYLLWGRLAFAAGAALIAFGVTALRRRLLPTMERLGSAIAAADSAAIQRFRRVHGLALAINTGQLVLLVWGTLQLSRA